MYPDNHYPEDTKGKAELGRALAEWSHAEATMFDFTDLELVPPYDELTFFEQFKGDVPEDDMPEQHEFDEPEDWEDIEYGDDDPNFWMYYDAGYCGGKYEAFDRNE